MTDFYAGSVFGVMAALLILIIVDRNWELTTTYKEDTSQAVELCRDGNWTKLDKTTIYCKDGAEYKLEEEL